MNRTKIEWTDFTANPVRYRTADGRVVWACEKLSAGCANCYAESLSHRYGGHRRAGEWNAATMATLTPFLDEKELREMLTSKHLSGKRVFIGDMTDIFGAWISDELLLRLFDEVLAKRRDVTWQILTKRPDRMAHFVRRHVDVRMDAHLWLGFSAENQETYAARWWHVAKLAMGGWTTFLSAEPLLGPIDLTALFCDICGNTEATLADDRGNPCQPWCVECDHEMGSLGDLSWVIVGGESGPNARPLDVDWARSIVKQCASEGVSCFVKQLGAVVMAKDFEMFPKPVALSTRDHRVYLKSRKGGDMAEWPEDLRVRQFPEAR